MSGDPGHFGPDSMMWKVNKEITVLFGGARALLMHAAHPLIAAGARQTSFYQRDPWKRLIRTLSLQNSVTFGTIDEANDSAERINRLHEVIKGKDEVTGEIYDALDHEQLLWVHACLQLSSIYFYEKTVKKLTEKEKNKYHEEKIYYMYEDDWVYQWCKDCVDRVEEEVIKFEILQNINFKRQFKIGKN